MTFPGLCILFSTAATVHDVKVRDKSKSPNVQVKKWFEVRYAAEALETVHVFSVYLDSFQAGQFFLAFAAQRFLTVYSND